ncbi:hypothetical protein DFH06DRAFT_401078 [Mycena polygramma]|nr:hypothetical protein DFH06DRAFT_401078 [Mycena polygramma]
MHRCLTIPELVDIICYELQPSTSSGTLAALARTSRAFLNPALDLLWREQTTLLNLLDCMPPDIFSLVTITNGGGTTILLLHRPIQKSDWDRPLVYAERIRRLFMDTDIQLSPIFPAMSMSLPSDCIFPNLEVLHWHDHPAEHAHLFVGPKLADLSFDCSYSRADLSLLSALPHICPGLKRLDVSGSGFGPMGSDEYASLRTLVDAFPDLEDIIVVAPDLASLLSIGRLQHLNSLDLAILPTELPSSPPAGLSFFPNVRHLELITPEVESVTNFLTFFTHGCLDSISVNMTNPPTTTTINAFFTSLVDCHLSHASLVSLSVCMARAVLTPGPASSLITPATLQALFCFKNLTELFLLAVGFDVDDVFVGEMARSWPQLQTLRLLARPHITQPRATIKSLQFLAQHCRYLEFLAITFDAIALPIIDSTFLPPAQTTLTYLNVGSSPIHTPISVAAILSAIFPRLGPLETYQDDNSYGDIEVQETEE